MSFFAKELRWGKEEEWKKENDSVATEDLESLHASWVFFKQNPRSPHLLYKRLFKWGVSFIGSFEFLKLFEI